MFGSHTLPPNLSDPFPSDSVSCLSWTSSLNNNRFLVASWDCTLRLYKKNSQGVMYQKTVIATPDPFLSLEEVEGPSETFAGSVTGSIYKIDGNAGRMTEIAKHDDAVKGIHCICPSDFYCTVSYDKTLVFRDHRTFHPFAKLLFPEKIYCSDYNHTQRLLALGLSNEKVFISHIADMARMLDSQRTPQLIDSSLGKGSQLSAISLSSNDNVIALATSDGRANISRVRIASDAFDLDSIVTFKAHKLDPGQGGNTRDTKILYPVHAIEFHPTVQHKLFTAGGDGKLHFWDYNTRDKINTRDLGATPIIKAAFNKLGSDVALGRGYDWAKGIQGDSSYYSSVDLFEVRPSDLS